MTNIIISNCCAGADIYNFAHKEFDNPFMWCRISGKNMLTLISRWGDIDWERVIPTANFDELHTGLNVDGIDIDYPHYKYDVWPTYKSGVDVRSKDILGYTMDKYRARIKRMLSGPVNPVFVAITYPENHMGLDDIVTMRNMCADRHYRSFIVTCDAVDSLGCVTVYRDPAVNAVPKKNPGYFLRKHNIYAAASKLITEGSL